MDKVYIEIGGYGEYYWDEFQYNVAYNHITTVVDTWMQVVQQQELENTITTLTPIYEEPVYEEEIVQDIPIEIEMLDVNVDVAVMDEPVFEDLGFEPDVPIVEMPEEIEVMAEIETVVAEIEQIDSISQPELTEPIVEIETPTEEPTANETQAEATTEETTEETIDIVEIPETATTSTEGQASSSRDINMGFAEQHGQHQCGSVF